MGPATGRHRLSGTLRPTISGIREIAKTDQAAQFVHDHLERGRQAYIVYPLIEESEKVKSANANLMLIFNAERFGLAQLHQLRGRIGSGAHKSTFIPVVDTDPENPEAVERLKILEETRDGFRIAEEDLKQCGPGEVLGTQQDGQPDLKFAELLGDLALVKAARAEAKTRGEEG